MTTARHQSKKHPPTLPSPQSVHVAPESVFIFSRNHCSPSPKYTFNITNGNFNVTISGLTISNGKVVGAEGALGERGSEAQGGGLLNNSNGTVNITNCQFANNNVIGGKGGDELGSLAGGGGSAGGGALAHSGAGLLRVTGCIFTGNSVTGGAGGNGDIAGFGSSGWGGSIALLNGTSQISDCTVSNSQATGGTGGTVSASCGGSLIPKSGRGGAGLGGGIYQRHSATTIQNCTISGNIANYGPSGGVSIFGGCDIGERGATGFSQGGGIEFDGGVLELEPITVIGCQITGNSTLIPRDPTLPNSNGGGGIGNSSNVLVKLINSTIANNEARTGGGVLHATYQDMEIINSTLSENSAVYSGGGAYIYSVGRPEKSLTFTGCTLTQNTANNLGGGITNEATVKLVNSTISGNLAGNTNRATGFAMGGGIFSGDRPLSVTPDGDPTTVSLLNTTITGNTTVGGTIISPEYMTNTGGGICLTYGTLFAKNSLIAGNTVNEFFGQGPDIGGRLIRVGGPEEAIYQPGVLTSQGYNLIGSTANATITGDTTGNLLQTNPRLSPLGDYGGPTQTHALLPGSPAINAGTTSGAPANDQRGVARVGNTDIGAFESRGFTMTIAGGNNQSAPINTLFPTALSLTVSSAFNEPVTGGQVRFGAPASGPSALLSSPFEPVPPTATISIRATANAYPGTYAVQATSNGSNDTAFTLTNACGTLNLTPSSLTTGTVGAAYPTTNFSVTPVEGAPYSFAVTAGTLPTGLMLTAAGALSGTPSQTGTFDFTITTTGYGGICGTSRAYSVNIVCPTISLSPTGLPGGTAGTPYNQTVTATPANGNYNFAVSSGQLPAGLSLNPTTGQLNGTPTQSGVFNFRVTATGVGACSGFRDYQLSIACPTITLSPATLATGSGGAPYSQQLSALPAGGNYSFTQVGGLLPPGVTLNADGLLSGTPTQTGAYHFRVTATGFGGCSTLADYSINITGCAAITVAPAALPDGAIGAAYNQTLGTTPAGTYAYSITSGALPPGLLLNAATGVISGSPTTQGSFAFRVTASAGQCTGFRDYVVNIGCAGVTITITSLPAAVIGTAYSQTIGAAPTGTYSFNVTGGSLPSGLTLNISTGALSGTPMTAGTFSFAVRAASASGCSATQSYSLVVNCPTITLSVLPVPALNTPYNQTLSATPAASYSFAITSGALPAGLLLNAATGVISGTPTTAGAYNFTITATGFGACTGNRNYTGTISGSTCPTITLPSLPGGQPGQLYNGTVNASPSGNYNYAVTTGSLPPGLTLYGSFGLIYGYPTQAGTFNFTITASSLSDANNCTGQRAYSLSIGVGATALRAANDFDGDGKADLAVWRGMTSEWLIRRSSDNQQQIVKWGASYEPYRDVVVSADYDGDGKTDIAVFRRGNGHWYIRQSSDGAVLDVHWGLGTDTPVPADYDGDGKADIAVWRGADTNWYIRRSSDGQVDTLAWGSSAAPYNDVAVPADYDGDGKTDLAVFRTSTGDWFIKQSSDGQITSKHWGLGTDTPVPADYDGDGKADIALWRGKDTNWYIVQSGNGAIKTISWGNAAFDDVPTPGDYDGDGKADVAVWRAASGEWLIKGSRDGSVVTRTHGLPGDTPVTNKP